MDVAAVGAEEVFGVEGVGRRGEGDNAPVQEHDAVETLGGHVQVVGRQEDGDAVTAQVVEDGQDGFLGGHVQAVERLVEQQQLRFLGQSAGQEDALLLAAGKLADLLAGKACCADTGQRGPRQGPIVAARPPQQANCADAAHHDHVLDCHREAPVDLGALRDVGDADVAAGAVAEDVEAAAVGVQRPGDELEQRALARAVWPDDGDALAAADAEGYRLQRVARAAARGKPVVIGHPYVLRLQRRRAGLVGYSVRVVGGRGGKRLLPCCPAPLLLCG